MRLSQDCRFTRLQNMILAQQNIQKRGTEFIETRVRIETRTKSSSLDSAVRFNINVIVQRFWHKRCVQLPAALSDPVILGRIRALRELYFAISVYALSFMKFMTVILNKGVLLGTAAAPVSYNPNTEHANLS